MARKLSSTPKYPTSFHQEMDVKEYIDELAARTNRPRAEIINKIIREHRDRQDTNPTIHPSPFSKFVNQ